eukprot:Em0001g2796a
MNITGQRLDEMVSSHFLKLLLWLLTMAVVRSSASYTPGPGWTLVAYLDMTDPTQQCPDSWKTITSPVASCGKKSTSPCDSFTINTLGASYQTVCGRFRGYQIGSPDAFHDTTTNIENYYVDGITVTYGSPGNRHHVYTYAAGLSELTGGSSCPCAGGIDPPLLVGSDYYCESGDPLGDWYGTEFFQSDVLWDRQQCGGDEVTCCNPADLPWFCKTFPARVTEDLEVRICTNEGLDNENVAIEFFELYLVEPNYAAVGATVGSAIIVVVIVIVLVATAIHNVKNGRRADRSIEKPH